MAGYKIGNLKLKNPYFLAPMAGINDIAFRILCKNAGAGLVYTGMLNPLTRKEIILDDKPAIQLFSTNERGIAEFIKKNEDNALLFDFNLGCSAKTAKEKCFGAFFGGGVEIIESILKIMRESTKKPITIKLRKSDEAFKIAEIAEKYCDAICVHPRTNKQGYSGKADTEFAEKLKQKTFLPIIYSGDVDEKNADGLLKKFDFVMIGRHAWGYPDIFAKLTGKKPVFGFSKYLKLALKYKLGFGHIKSQAISFTKYRAGSGKLRRQLAKAKSLDELKEILENREA
jgi:tRNA-dihydrouridine synthase B